MDKAIELLEEVKERLKRKNQHYARLDDPFFNFEVGRAVLRARGKWQAAFAYATKHIAAIAKWYESGEMPSDPEVVREVLGDVIAYMAIMYAIYEEERGGDGKVAEAWTVTQTD